MNKTIKTLGAIMAVALLLFAAVACGSDSDKKVYDYLVTFNYNAGEIENAPQNQTLGVKENSFAVFPKQPGDKGYIDSFKDLTPPGCYLEGWYLPQTDADGNPVTDENKKVLLDRKWDFEKDRVTSDITLYANLYKQATLTIRVEGGEDVVFKGKPGEIRKEPSSVFTPKKEGSTFYGYYEDAEFTKPFVWPYEFTTEDKTIHAKFIEGNWTIVTTAKEFNGALSKNPNGHIFVDADLDFSETKWLQGKEFNGEIDGNGHTFRGINVKFTANKKTQANFGLFGILKSKANIHDLNIENVQAEFTAFDSIVGLKAALFAWKAESGATLKNVTVGGTLVKGKMAEGADVQLTPFIAIDEGANLENCDYSQIIVKA